MFRSRQAAVWLPLALNGCGWSFAPPVEPDICQSHVDLNQCSRDGAGDASDASADELRADGRDMDANDP
jgi:hypothetical protein